MSSGMNGTKSRGVFSSVAEVRASDIKTDTVVWINNGGSYDILDSTVGSDFILDNGRGAYARSSGVSTVNWGGIGGAISNQTDLQAALSNKADKIAGKELSDNNYSDTDKALVDEIPNIQIVNGNQQTDINNLTVDKVDKVAGKELSDENYTAGEKTKLAGIDDTTYWKGEYLTLTALQLAHPTSNAGSYAFVDAGVGVDAIKYIWDSTDNQWVSSGSGGGSETPASIKVKYESNPDTNAYDDNAVLEVAKIADKVDKVAGKGLSENDFTAADKALVDTISNKESKSVKSTITTGTLPNWAAWIVDTSSSASVSAPTSPVDGEIFTAFDSSNNAETNNATITTVLPTTIVSGTLDKNGQSGKWRYDAAGDVWDLVFSQAPASGGGIPSWGDQVAYDAFSSEQDTSSPKILRPASNGLLALGIPYDSGNYTTKITSKNNTAVDRVITGSGYFIYVNFWYARAAIELHIDGALKYSDTNQGSTGAPVIPDSIDTKNQALIMLNSNINLASHASWTDAQKASVIALCLSQGHRFDSELKIVSAANPSYTDNRTISVIYVLDEWVE